MTSHQKSSPGIEGMRRFLKAYSARVGTVLLCLVCAAALSASFLFPVDPMRIVGPALIWPFEQWKYPLGTDALGRDIAAIIFHGAQTTLIIGLSVSLVGTVIGTTLGAVAGYYGGWVDEAIMRLTELFQIIPNLVLVLAVITIFGVNVQTIILAIAAVSWPMITRVTRAEFLSLKSRDFVLACRSIGMTDLGIIFREVLPNAIPPIIVLSSLSVATAILFEAALSFLGLGDPSVASWGKLIGDGRELIRTAWYVSAVPGVAIFLTVLGLNLIGDGLNDALNPKLRDA